MVRIWDGMAVWAWEMLILSEDFVTPPGCDDNPLELHRIKKKSGESPVVEMQTPTRIYICSAWAMCAVIQRTRKLWN